MIWQFIFAAVKFVFAGNSLWAMAARFVAGTVITQLLAGEQKSEGPRLNDLRVQVSSYGNPIPRIYGSRVRIAGNVIDKSNMIETFHKKKKKMLGITVSSQTWYTYSVGLVIMLAEGQLPVDGLVRIFANGRVIFDRDAPGAIPPSAPSTVGGAVRSRLNQTNALFDSVRFYCGSGDQQIDPFVQALHPGQPVPAYRHSAYVVIQGLQLKDWGNQIPNIEFELETNFLTVAETVANLGSFADVEIHALNVPDSLRGYIVAQAGSVWSAIEPLAGVFSFDLVSQGRSFRAKQRGRGMRTILSEEDFAARPPGDNAKDTADNSRGDPNSYPDEVSVTYMDYERGYQPNTQRALRNEGYAQNKITLEVAVVLNATEARQVAGRTLAESLAGANSIKIYVRAKHRWLEASDVVGIPIGGEIRPFRISKVVESPNGVVELNGIFEDVFSYTGDIPGDAGQIPPNDLQLPGDTILQMMDAPILQDENDTGWYFGVVGTGPGWVGASIYRADTVGSPLVYELIVEPAVNAVIGDVVGTLGSGPTDVFDYVNTLNVSLFDGELESVTEEAVVTSNANFAWVGPEDGADGEYINFTTAIEGSPGVWALSGLLRGRRGTEQNVTHASGDRFVLIEADPIGRFDFGPIDWNVQRTWKPVSVYQDDSEATPFVFANTGEGKKPYSGVHMTAQRNSANNDIFVSWERRTRFQVPALGGGPVPLGEETEAYSVDIRSGLTVVRTLSLTTPSFNYTEAMQTEDGHSLGSAVTLDAYQLSGIRGRGHALTGTV